jgi:hypothetical protein
MECGGWISLLWGQMNDGSKNQVHKDIPTHEIQIMVPVRSYQSVTPQKGRWPIKSGLTRGIKVALNPFLACYASLCSCSPFSPLLMVSNKCLLSPTLHFSNSFTKQKLPGSTIRLKEG